MTKSKHRLVVVSGPSCAGKSPLKDALDREFPDLAKPLQTPVLFNSRTPRPDEEDGEDYHFRKRSQIEKLDEQDRYLVIEARDDLQAVDLDELEEMLGKGDVFYEGNVHIALALMRHERLQQAELVDVFVSPLSAAEVRELAKGNAELEDVVSEMMRRRLIRRSLSKKPFLALPDLKDIESRATSAFHALQHAHEFRHVIPNHDGEDSDNWEAFPRPIGDARRSVHALAALLAGDRAELLETWPKKLLPEPDCQDG